MRAILVPVRAFLYFRLPLLTFAFLYHRLSFAAFEQRGTLLTKFAFDGTNSILRPASFTRFLFEILNFAKGSVKIFSHNVWLEKLFEKRLKIEHTLAVRGASCWMLSMRRNGVSIASAWSKSWRPELFQWKAKDDWAGFQQILGYPNIFFPPSECPADHSNVQPENLTLKFHNKFVHFLF